MRTVSCSPVIKVFSAVEHEKASAALEYAEREMHEKVSKVAESARAHSYYFSKQV